MENNNASQSSNEEKSCQFCHSGENEKPIFTADYKGRKLRVCARCLPGLIHG